jgi:DNA repair exonuclease SbcCD ATPase subunit
MSKTWYGHHIETIKGEDYVLHKDYNELQNKLEKEIKELRDIFNYEKDLRIKSEKEINRLNNIIDEFNRNYIEIIKRCDEMIKNKYYSNATAIDKYANEIKNIVKYYVPDAE